MPEKGHKYLIKAFSLIEDQSWKLVILGDGPLKLNLEKQAQSLGIEDRLIMPGSVPNVDEWLARSSIFAFSSVSEGFPNALAEAMAARLPAVSFDCNAGPRDIIVHNDNGLLIKEKDVVEFTTALDLLMDDKELRERLGENALQIKEKLSVEDIAKRYFEFITP